MGFYCFILKRKKAKVFFCHRVVELMAHEVGLRAGRSSSLNLFHGTVNSWPKADILWAVINLLSPVDCMSQYFEGL